MADNWLQEGYRKAWCDGCGELVYYRTLRRGSWRKFRCVLCDAEVDPNVRHQLDRVGNWMSLMEKRDA